MIAAERALAANAVQNPNVTRQVQLTADQFDHPQLGAIWASVATLGKQVTPTGIVTEATRHGVRVDPSLITDIITEVHVGSPEAWADEVRDACTRRNISNQLMRVRQLLDNGNPTDEVTAALNQVHAAPAAEAEVEAFMTLDEFCDQPLPAEQWVIPDLLARGDRLVLTGYEGLGKSVLIRELAVCAAAGFDPFTRQDFPPVRVTFLDLENPARTMVRVLSSLRTAVGKYGRNTGARFMVRRHPKGLDVAKPADRAYLHMVCDTFRPDLLVIGPVYKMYVGGSGDREEDLARTVTSLLDELRERYDCAVILEHHSPHGAAGQRRDVRPFGSSLWRRWPEFGFGLVPSEGCRVDERWVDVVPWRGSREDRPWPKTLGSGGVSGIPWVDPNPRPRRTTTEGDS